MSAPTGAPDPLVVSATPSQREFKQGDLLYCRVNPGWPWTQAEVIKVDKEKRQVYMGSVSGSAEDRFAPWARSFDWDDPEIFIPLV